MNWKYKKDPQYQEYISQRNERKAKEKAAKKLRKKGKLKWLSKFDPKFLVTLPNQEDIEAFWNLQLGTFRKDHPLVHKFGSSLVEGSVEKAEVNQPKKKLLTDDDIINLEEVKV